MSSGITSFGSMVKGGTSPSLPSDQRTAVGQVVRAPADSSQSLFIVMPGFSLAFPYEVIADRWLHGSTLPAAGVSCLIVFDDAGDAWVPLWDGFVAGGGSGNIDGGGPNSVYGGDLPVIDGGGV